jgi:hypothetical protein
VRAGWRGDLNIQDRLERRSLAGGYVIDLAALPFLQQKIIGADDVPDVGIVAAGLEVSDLDHGWELVLFDERGLSRPIRADEVRRLPRPRMRKWPGDDDVEILALRIEFAQELAARNLGFWPV